MERGCDKLRGVVWESADCWVEAIEALEDGWDADGASDVC